MGKGTITALRETAIKSRIADSSSLSEGEYFMVPQGKEIEIADLIEAKWQHYKFKHLNDKFGFIYKPHWEIDLSEDIPKWVKLEVIYRSQLDNWKKYHGDGSRQCCLTSHVMAADYLLNGAIAAKAKAKGLLEPEDLYGKVLYPYGDTTNPKAHTPALKDFGIDSYFTYTGSIEDLLLCLRKGVPVPLGVAYKSSGHYVCAVGYNEHGVWIHDPFGVRYGMSDYYDTNSKGDYDFVTWDWLQAKWVDQGSEAGWMRVMVGVHGKSTGVPTGL